MKKKRYLPIGSVVLLKDSDKKFVIIGYYYHDYLTEKTYDYCGCIYPIGVIPHGLGMCFNQEDVEKVIDLGFVTKNYEIYTNKLKEMIDSGELDKKIEEREKIEKDVANGVFSAMKDIRKREINGKK